jgi:hypothetical protein
MIMADIADELNAISTSIYGREMRGAIHDAIKKVNDDVGDIHTEFAQISQAVTDIREDNENISNELAQLENAFIVDEERDASNSWSGLKYVFSNGVLTRSNDEDYECKIYYGLKFIILFSLFCEGNSLYLFLFHGYSFFIISFIVFMSVIKII